MQTPLPAQLEYWLKIAGNKKSPHDLKQNAVLHLKSIRDIIDKVLAEANKPVNRTSQKARNTR